MIKIARALGPDGFGTYELDWTKTDVLGSRVEKFAAHLVSPGFVDNHIHGAFGIDFMSSNSRDLCILSEKLEQVGYESWLPTTVTASASDILSALRNLPDHPAVGGFHLEGPFISSEYPGAQPPDKIAAIPIGESEWDEILNHPKLRIMTLAPELPNALELIRRMSARGVEVSMGHTNASYDECRFGFEMGSSQMTHFFNAMRPLHHRDVGPVGYGFLQPYVSCELIYDRHHVSREAVALLKGVKSCDKIIAVSDSTLATGLTANQFVQMWGNECEILNDKLVLAGTKTLAGSTITLLDAFRNLADDFDIESAIRYCCINPRKAAKLNAPPRCYNIFNEQFELVERYVRNADNSFVGVN